jgi:hypothetical protein
VLFSELLNQTGITWLPSDNQACHQGLINYQRQGICTVLRTWEVNKGQILNVTSAYL